MGEYLNAKMLECFNVRMEEMKGMKGQFGNVTI
jgi:hypothetical protein